MANSNNGQTLGILNNVETKKVLVNVFQVAERESEAKYLSTGSTILTASAQIAETKYANILLPLMNGVKPVKDVLIEARDGAVSSKEGFLNEATLKMANEMITEPLFIRPRDGEVIGFDQVNAYSKTQGTTIATAVDRVFYSTLAQMGKTGIAYKQGISGSGSVKAKFVDFTTIAAMPEATLDNIRDKGAAFINLLRAERRSIKAIKDLLIQAKFSNSDFRFVIDVNYEELIENDSRYNLRNAFVPGGQPATSEGNGNVRMADGMLDGSEVIYSKQLPAGIAFMIIVGGAATSLFALRKTVNLDKTPGVNAYKYSMEFDEGTGVWLPHLTTFGSTNLTTFPVQARVTFDPLVLAMDNSTTLPGTGNAGLDAAGTLAADESLSVPTDKSSIAVIKAYLDLHSIDYTGKTTKTELLALIPKS